LIPYDLPLIRLVCNQVNPTYPTTMKFLSLLGLAALIHCASASGGIPLNGARQEKPAQSSYQCVPGNCCAPEGAVFPTCNPPGSPRSGTEAPAEEAKVAETEGTDGTDQPGTDQDGTDQDGTDQDGTDQDGTDQEDDGDLDNDDEEVFHLIGGDGEKREITKTAAKMIQLVQDMLEGDKLATEFEFTNISGPTLQHIIDYLNHHDGKTPAEISKPIRSKIMSKINVESKEKNVFIEEEDVTFINRIGYTSPSQNENYDEWIKENNDGQTQCPTNNKNAIFDIILAVNYLNIKSLLHLGCVKIATLIKGESPEEIKRILGGGRRRLHQIFGLDKLLESDRGL